MKCDELKVYVPQDGPYGLCPEEGGELVEEETCYLKSEVDAAIAELNAAHHKERDEYISMVYSREQTIKELKKKLEDAQASAYAESVDAGMQDRRLKRALWLARAERARTDSIYWLNLMYDEKWSSVKFTVRRKYGANVKPRQTTRTPEKWFNVWDVVELYCKHKYKEYK